VRAYWRHRAAWLADRAAPSPPMPKARHPMNVQFTQGLTDLTGATGLAMIGAMVAGERHPVHLARLRAPR
jgi:transposase